MKLYDAAMPAPNPRRVRIFLAEKGMTVERVPVSLAAGEHKLDDHRARNSLGQVPVLELDDGTAISETVSICRYLEALKPDPPLFGVTPKEIGLIDMWIRRVEQQVGAHVGHVWINTHPYTERYARTHGIQRYADFGEYSRGRALSGMDWLDREIAGRDYIAGDAYSMADIVTLTILDFSAFIGLPVPDECARLKTWHARVSARPSADA
ncbi:MAG: glutathione S-transferase family protein [Alphaproteobacteria bacterium]